jgi:hypothetical protein
MKPGSSNSADGVHHNEEKINSKLVKTTDAIEHRVIRFSLTDAVSTAAGAMRSLKTA